MQSWVLWPVDFKAAKTTKTFVYSAEKLTSTSTPHRNSICFFRGKTEWRGEKEKKKIPTNINQKGLSGCLLMDAILKSDEERTPFEGEKKSVQAEV